MNEADIFDLVLYLLIILLRFFKVTFSIFEFLVVVVVLSHF